MYRQQQHYQDASNNTTNPHAHAASLPDQYPDDNRHSAYATPPATVGIVGELSPRKEQSRSRKVPQAIYVASKFSILNARDTVHFNQGNGTLGISVRDVGEMTLHRSMIYIQDAEEEVSLCYGEQATNVASTFMLRILWPGLPPFEQRLRKHCLEYMRAELAHEIVSVIYAWWKRMTSYPISSSYEHRQWHPSRLDLGALRLMKLWNVSVGSWQPVIAVNGDIPDIDPSVMPPLTSQAPGFIEPSSPELSAALNTTSIGRQSPPKIGSPREHAFHPYSRPPSQSRTQSYRQMPQIYARTSQGHAERMQVSPPSNAWIHPQSPLPPHLQGHSQMPLTRSSDPLSQPNDHPAFATSSNYATVPDYDIIPQRSLVSRSALAFMSMKAISFVGLPHKTPGANLHALLAPENAVSCVQHAHGGVFVSDVINGNSSFVVRLEWPGLPLWEEQVLGSRFTRGEVAHHVATVIYKWWKSAKTMPLPNDLDLHKWHPSVLCFRSMRLLELRGIAPGIWQPVCAVDLGSVEHDQGTQKGRTQSQGRRTSEEHSRANGAASIPNDMPPRRPTYY